MTKVTKDRLVHRGRQVRRATREIRAQPARRVYLDLLVTMANLARMGYQVPLVRRAKRVTLVQRVQ